MAREWNRIEKRRRKNQTVSNMIYGSINLTNLKAIFSEKCHHFACYRYFAAPMRIDVNPFSKPFISLFFLSQFFFSFVRPCLEIQWNTLKQWNHSNQIEMRFESHFDSHILFILCSSFFYKRSCHAKWISLFLPQYYLIHYFVRNLYSFDLYSCV